MMNSATTNRRNSAPNGLGWARHVPIVAAALLTLAFATGCDIAEGDDWSDDVRRSADESHFNGTGADIEVTGGIGDESLTDEDGLAGTLTPPAGPAPSACVCTCFNKLTVGGKVLKSFWSDDYDAYGGDWATGGDGDCSNDSGSEAGDGGMWSWDCVKAP